MTFLVLLVAALFWRLRLFSGFIRMLQSIRDQLGVSERTTRSVIRFYEKFRDVCEHHGLTVPESATAIETADAAERFFSDKLCSLELRSAPVLIAGAFNEVRFGRRELSPSRAEDVRRALDAFAVAIAQ